MCIQITLTSEGGATALHVCIFSTLVVPQERNQGRFIQVAQVSHSEILLLVTHQGSIHTQVCIDAPCVVMYHTLCKATPT